MIPKRRHPNRFGNGLCPPVNSKLDELEEDWEPAFELAAFFELPEQPKPCVVCGQVTETQDGKLMPFYFDCECGRGAGAFTRETALKAWNRQANDRIRAQHSRFWKNWRP